MIAMYALESEKTLLDNYEVPCALLYENANLYGRAPLAMPIRLVVRDDQADWAMCILNGDFEAAAKLEQIPAEMSPEGSESSLPGLPEARPWELLVIAFYFFLPAICFCGQIIQPSFRTTGRCEQKSPP
jgi:hypothetical protein